MYSDKDEKILKSAGWTIVCGSPLEIEHEDGSFASEQGAEIIINFLIGDDKGDWVLDVFNNNATKIYEGEMCTDLMAHMYIGQFRQAVDEIERNYI